MCDRVKYLTKTVTNQNCVLEIKSRLDCANVDCHLVQDLFLSTLLSQNIKIKMYGSIILPVVLYGCENWLLTLRVEHRLSVHKRHEVRQYCRYCMRSSVIYEGKSISKLQIVIEKK